MNTFNMYISYLKSKEPVSKKVLSIFFVFAFAVLGVSRWIIELIDEIFSNIEDYLVSKSEDKF